MNLLESGEMYLETIYILQKKNENVRSLDIAEYRNFSKPSVSRAVNLLKQGEYITVDKDGFIHLTEIGIEIAKKIYDRHTTLTNYLMLLGVSEETAALDACKMEHDISEETFIAIKNRFEAEK